MITILTADGYAVHEGDRVFNYYDCKWGVIGRVEERAQPDPRKGQGSDTPIEEWSSHWFDHIADDGSRTLLDGIRISKEKW